MEEINWLRTSIAILIGLGGIVAAYFRSIHLLEQRLRDKIESQLKEVADLKVEIERLKNKDELQQQVIDQLKKHVLDNLPALYKALEQKKTNK